MYAPIEAISFHGIIRMPISAVISPPVTYEMRFGLRFEKSFEGETTLAAMLVVSCAAKMTMRGKDDDGDAAELRHQLDRVRDRHGRKSERSRSSPRRR